MLLFPGLLAMWFYRRSRRIHHAGHPDWAQLVRVIGRAITGVEIAPTATIGQRFWISHGHGTVIGDARIGDDCRVLHGVTIGRAGFEGDDAAPSAYPQIGDRVTIYAGAAVLGGVTVGDDAAIGA